MLTLFGHLAMILPQRRQISVHNLLYSTLGNVVGGVLLVGLPFTYLNPREGEEQMQIASVVREPPQA